MARTKYVMQQCPYCHQETKMEIIPPQESDLQSGTSIKSWYRCLRCKHSSFLDQVQPLTRKNGSVIKFDKENQVEYTSDKVFKVGQTIFHTEWNDVGLVTSKQKISSGVQSITVVFEDHGERKLIENIQID